MIYKTVIGSQSSEFDIDNSSTLYVLGQGTSIQSSTNGISEDDNWHLNTIQINGMIDASSMNAYGIKSGGSETNINIGKSGVVNADFGVYVSGDHANITNNGQITSARSSIYFSFSDNSHFVNNGMLDGELVIDRSDKTTVVLNKGSVLENSFGSAAIDDVTLSGQTSHIVNRGTISVSNPVSGWSLYLREGDDTLVNRGTISGGAITLGDGNDVYDGRGGELGAGVLLEGDSGDDTFILDKKIEVYENVGGGTDTIKATISMSLSSGQLIGQEIENLTLLGHKNINGTGNGLDNMLLGNSGDNKLAGMDGTDTIMGRAGNDRLDGGLGADMLTGGQGSDTFIFKTGYGHDTVTDFQNGHDHIDLSGWAAIKDFQDLEAHHLSVSGNDLVITAGADTLTIEHMAKAQLDASDFVF